MVIVNDNAFNQDDFYSKPILWLFGTENCKVCDAVKLKMPDIVKEKMPEIDFFYVDSMKNVSLSAQFNVFTAPVVIFTFYGKEYHRWVRSFSIAEIVLACQRIIQLAAPKKSI